jgi:hypothetical protein
MDTVADRLLLHHLGSLSCSVADGVAKFWRWSSRQDQGSMAPVGHRSLVHPVGSILGKQTTGRHRTGSMIGLRDMRRHETRQEGVRGSGNVSKTPSRPMQDSCHTVLFPGLVKGSVRAS